MVCANTKKERELLHESVEFFSSETFAQILERYISYYIRRMIPYTDLYYNGKLLETREEMSAFCTENLPPRTAGRRTEAAGETSLDPDSQSPPGRAP